MKAVHTGGAKSLGQHCFGKLRLYEILYTLNQGFEQMPGLWFAKIERDVIARGVFTSMPDLARKLRRYINAYSANAQPIRWKYSDVTRRIRSNDLAAQATRPLTPLDIVMHVK